MRICRRDCDRLALGCGSSGITNSSEITDVGWNLARSEWGIMQNGVAFLTFFVYELSPIVHLARIGPSLTRINSPTSWSGRTI